MGGQRNIGLLAHVDAGKTTLSEALLFTSGQRRTLAMYLTDYFKEEYNEQKVCLSLFKPEKSEI